jgi:hypothetical protein
VSGEGLAGGLDGGITVLTSGTPKIEACASPSSCA